ncbi:MAG: peptidylprolyl isomerase [Leptolyngbyaceae cyanobacterium]
MSTSPTIQNGHASVTPESLIPLLQRYGMLPQLIREILIDRAIAPFSLSEDESLKAYEQFYQRHQLKSEDDLQSWLSRQGMHRDQLDHLMTRSLRLEKFKHQTWDHQVESYFLQRKAKLDRVIYSLIRTNSLELAQELYFRIQEGEQSFSELARIHSQGPEAQTGGLIGPVELSVPHPVLANVLASSQPGQISPPTRLMEWIVLVRLEQFLPAQLDDTMRPRLLNELFDEWIQTQMESEGRQLTQQLLSDSSIPA